MKKILLTVLLALPFVFLNSCSKDDENASIVGKWQINDVAVSANGLSSTLLNTATQEVKNNILKGCGSSSTIEYFADKTYKLVDGCGNNEIVTGTWSQEGTTLTTTDTGSGRSDTDKIHSITANELTIDASGKLGVEENLPTGVTLTVLLKYKKVN